MQLKNLQLKVKVEVWLKFEMTFLTLHLVLSIFYPNVGSNNPALFRVCTYNIFGIPFTLPISQMSFQ